MPNEPISPDGIPASSSAGTELTLEQAGQQAASQEAAAGGKPEVTPNEPAEDGKSPLTTPDEPTDNIDFDTFLDAAGKDRDITAPDKTKLAEKKDAVGDEKKDESVKVIPDETKPEVTPIKVDDKSRDFTGIEEKDIPHFKRMANDAFAAMKPVYLENKKLKTDLTDVQTKFKTLQEQGPQLPESYFDNPQSYLLDPDFQGKVESHNMSQQILNHWQQQYSNVSEGAKEVIMIDFDKNTGKLYASGKVPADRGIEAKLLTYVNHAQHQLNQKQVEIQTHMATHASKVNEGVTSINTMRSQFFNGFYNTPENKAIYEPLVQERLKVLPKAFQTNPMAHMMAESLVMNQVLAQLLQKAAAEKNAAAPVAAQNKPALKRNIQPNADEIHGAANGKGGKSDTTEVTVDDFDRVKNGL